MGVKQGKIVWHELLTTDPHQAIAFYTKLIGWTMTEFPSPTEPYYVLNNGSTGVGGAMRTPAGAQSPPPWRRHGPRENAGDTHAKAKARGAKTYVPPTDIPTVGRFAVMADPQGVTFA